MINTKYKIWYRTSPTGRQHEVPLDALSSAKMFAKTLPDGSEVMIHKNVALKKGVEYRFGGSGHIGYAVVTRPVWELYGSYIIIKGKLVKI